ncbi:MAG: MCP four helix bundle domain-containing protein, partial [Chloroflexota bacterium]
MRLGVRGKLLAGFGIVVGFIIFVGSLGAYGLHAAGNDIESLTDVEMAGVITILDAEITAMQMQRDIRQAILVSDPAEHARVRQAYGEAEKHFNAQLDNLSTQLQTAEARAKLTELKTAAAT